MSGITGALEPHGRELLQRSIREARACGLSVCLDVNYRSYLWTPQEARTCLEELAPPVDLLLVAERDARLLWPGLAEGPEAAARELADLFGAQEVVVTRGGGGAGSLAEKSWVQSPALEAIPHDPIGRGDAFAAGYLWGRLEGRAP